MLPCYKSIKIVLDKIFALVLAIILAPVFMLIILILVFTGNDVFFSQIRIGFLGRSFVLYKFKTMHDAKGVSDSLRITRFGHFLRKTSLDELPQLWNILKGEMSFIGPRPLLVEYLPLYSDHHQKRHWVIPGITGLAQINGRNNLSWTEKFDLDVDYQENINFWTDLKVSIKTIINLFEGSKGTHIVEKFSGYKVLKN